MSSTIGILILVVFAAIILWQGALAMKQTKSSDDYNVAGRRIGPWLIGATVTATLCSTSTYLGFGGWIYRDGTAVYAVAIAAALALAVAAIFFIGPFRQYGKVTIADFLGDRYDSEVVRLLTAIVVIVVTLGVAVAATIGMGLVISQLTGFSYEWAVILAVVVASGYCLAGGVLSVIWTDALQLAIMIAAVLIGFPFALAAVGGGSIGDGWDRVISLSEINWFTWSGASGGIAPSLLLGQILLWTTGGAVLPYVFSRGAVGRSPIASIQGFTLAVPFYLIFVMLPLVLVLGSVRVEIPDIANTDTAFIRLATDLVHPAIGYPLLFAIVAAGLSSMDTQILVVSQSMALDIYSRAINPKATDLQRLRVSRGTVIVAGVIILVLALAQPAGIFWVASAAIGLGGAALFAPILLGIYSRNGTSLGAIGAIVGGPLVMILLSAFGVSLAFLGPFGHPIVPALIVSFALYFVGSALSDRASARALEVFDQVQPGRVV